MLKFFGPKRGRDNEKRQTESLLLKKGWDSLTPTERAFVLASRQDGEGEASYDALTMGCPRILGA